MVDRHPVCEEAQDKHNNTGILGGCLTHRGTSQPELLGSRNQAISWQTIHANVAQGCVFLFFSVTQWELA